MPLPCVTAILLGIFATLLLIKGGGGLRRAGLFVIVCAFLSAIVGLRLIFDVPLIAVVQPALAALAPPLAWLCFARTRTDWIHLLPVVFVALLTIARSHALPPVDLVLLVAYVGYGLALIRHAVQPSDRLPDVRLAEIRPVQMATLATGVWLIASAIVDLAVAGDYGLNSGANRALIITIAHAVTLPMVAYCVVVAGAAVAAPGPSAIRPNLASPPADADVLKAFETAMAVQRLFRDPDLTLNRLARRLGMPARQISGALNRAFGRNVSQIVNEYRVREAMRLLEASDLAITAVMFEAGFQTKSNFNREFRRVTAMSPSAYRRGATATVTPVSPELETPR